MDRIEIDPAKFKVFHNVQMRSGYCLKRGCSYFDHSIGPQETEPHCLECFNAAIQKLGIKEK